jgi:3-hydroxymyristoyl/3-hydroxydecanoyl-(acyl carrier protein) dehydratase
VREGAIENPVKLNQQYPFCFIDRIEGIMPGEWIAGKFNLTKASPYLIAGIQKLPLFVLLEIMGQHSELLIRNSWDLKGKKGFLAGMNTLSYHGINESTCQLKVRNTIESSAMGIFKTSSVVSCNKDSICQGTFIHVIR